MAKNIHYLHWNSGDTWRSYLKHAVQDTVQMWPFAKVYGLRYYWDRDYRRKCRRSFSNRLDTERYGANWQARRRHFIRNLHIRDGMGCNLCRIIEPVMTIDHIVPLFAGGTNTLDNVQLLCNACHVEKSKGENKRHAPNSRHKEKALQSEAKKVKALRFEKKALGTMQGFNPRSLRKSVLYVREDWPRWRKLAYRTLHTKRQLRGLPTLRPAEPTPPVLQLQHKLGRERGAVLPPNGKARGGSVRGTVVPGQAKGG